MWTVLFGRLQQLILVSFGVIASICVMFYISLSKCLCVLCLTCSSRFLTSTFFLPVDWANNKTTKSPRHTRTGRAPKPRELKSFPLQNETWQRCSPWRRLSWCWGDTTWRRPNQRICWEHWWCRISGGTVLCTHQDYHKTLLHPHFAYTSWRLQWTENT